MIRIKRGKRPASLGSGEGAARYSREDVVAELFRMQHGKCCYCEQSIPREGHMKAVEHFHPRSIFTGKVNEWSNLLLVCAQCNGKKSDKFPVELSLKPHEAKVVFIKTEIEGERLLLDPSSPDDPDPEEHLEFIVDEVKEDWGIVTEKNGSHRGRLTIDVTGVSTGYYVDRRREHYFLLMTKYVRLLEAMQKARRNKNVENVMAALAHLEENISDASEFAAFSRTFFRAKNIRDRVRQLREDLAERHED